MKTRQYYKTSVYERSERAFAAEPKAITLLPLIVKKKKKIAVTDIVANKQQIFL